MGVALLFGWELLGELLQRNGIATILQQLNNRLSITVNGTRFFSRMERQDCITRVSKSVAVPGVVPSNSRNGDSGECTRLFTVSRDAFLLLRQWAIADSPASRQSIFTSSMSGGGSNIFWSDKKVACD